MSAVAIIPARGGSVRIPGKNIREFHGKPIIAYSIDTAIRSGLFDAGVWVSTDSPEIVKIAWDAGAKVHPRTAPLAMNDVGTQEVMRAALAEIFPGEATRADYACCIYATAPMLTDGDLYNGYNVMRVIDDYAFVPGWCYWGRAEWFGVKQLREPAPLEIEAERYIDINTLDDWIRAERMYEDWRSRP